MKDCTTCKDRAEINPQYKYAVWLDIPCASCKLTEPPRHHMIEYGEQFEHPSANTWAIVDPLEAAEDATERASVLMVYLGSGRYDRALQRLSAPNDTVSRFVSLFSPRQELDIIDVVLNWDRTLEVNGKDRGRSRVAQCKAMQRIKRVIESISDDASFELSG
jgi:NAD-dependent SIR2 family protein deacetylase